MADICREKGVFRIMAGGRMPTMSEFDIVKSPEELGWSKSFKLAFVDLPE